jgi:hypothetical protein
MCSPAAATSLAGRFALPYRHRPRPDRFALLAGLMLGDADKVYLAVLDRR